MAFILTLAANHVVLSSCASSMDAHTDLKKSSQVAAPYKHLFDIVNKFCKDMPFKLLQVVDL